MRTEYAIQYQDSLKKEWRTITGCIYETREEAEWWLRAASAHYTWEKLRIAVRQVGDWCELEKKR